MAQTAFDALNLHICIISKDGTILTANRAWKKFAEANGVDPSSVSEGANYLEACRRAAGNGSEDGAEVARCIHQIAEGRQQACSFEYACHSPTQKRWFTAKITQLRWGGETYIVIAHDNITTRKLIEEELHASRFMLSAAERLAHIGAWEMHFDSGTVILSEELQNIYGVGMPSLTLDEIILVVHPDDRDRVMKAVKKAGETHGPIDFEMRMINQKTGQEGIVHVSGEFFPGPEGLYDRAVGATIDITEQRHQEHEREKYLSQLRALSDRLQHAGESERSWIAREIHDEFGQSLTRLAFDISLLKGTIRKDTDAALRDCESIEEMTGRLIRSVQKISAKLRPALLDEFGLIEAMKWHIRDFQTHSTIECSWTIVEDVPEVKTAVATTFFRILQEALNNVQRHARAAKVFVRFYPDNHGLVLEVEDNGVGITEEQANDAVSIGIIGMKERARACGGELSVSSEPGKFTLITVRIPFPTNTGTQPENDNHDENTDR